MNLAEHQKAANIVRGHHKYSLIDGKHQYIPISWSAQENQYPKVRYHAIKDPKTVQNEVEEQKLTPAADGWQDMPVTAQEDDWKGQLTKQTAQIVTPAHVDFCKEEGYGVQTVAELQTLLNNSTKITPKARQSFFAAADRWIKAKAAREQQGDEQGQNQRSRRAS
jgi:hypothetical protein